MQAFVSIHALIKMKYVCFSTRIAESKIIRIIIFYQKKSFDVFKGPVHFYIFSSQVGFYGYLSHSHGTQGAVGWLLLPRYLICTWMNWWIWTSLKLNKGEPFLLNEMGSLILKGKVTYHCTRCQ